MHILLSFKSTLCGIHYSKFAPVTSVRFERSVHFFSLFPLSKPQSHMKASNWKRIMTSLLCHSRELNCSTFLNSQSGHLQKSIGPIKQIKEFVQGPCISPKVQFTLVQEARASTYLTKTKGGSLTDESISLFIYTSKF